MPASDWYSDTDPQALEVFLRLQREMSADQKIAAVFQMSGMLLRLAEEAVRRQYPTADDREVLRRVAARHLDRDTMIRAFGWDPESPPC
jgi:hypothetical protein